MKRVRRKISKIIAFSCLGIAMLFSGLFFVGCGDNPADKLTLTADKSTIEVYVGESENITFNIGNYTNGIDTNLNFSLIDSTISSTKSEHAELEVVNHDGTQTTVKITGVSGGTTTIVASTVQGNKKASVTINVKQYSSKFEMKNDSLLYVSKNKPFVPSEKLFNFDDTATERKVTFHFVDSINKEANDTNAFVRAELVKDNESGVYSVVFYQEDGYAISLDEYKNLIEGTGISIVAKYYNRQTDKTETQQFSLTVLYGFEENVKIEAYDNDGAVENIELITNDPGTETENWRTKKFKVKVPHVENIEGGENVIFDCVYDKNGLILVEKTKNTAESNENYDVYDFDVVSAAVASNETSILLRLYYKIDGVSYIGSGDSSVEQQIQIPVRVRIAPTKIVVNSTEETSPENLYSFYDHYDGDFGWQEFKVDVYDPKSSYEYVSMTFDSDLIVKYKNKTYVAGVTQYQLKIDDVTLPVYIRGASVANETSEPKQIEFEVVSDYLREGYSCKYVCNYSILTGTTKLEYDNPNTSFEYKPNQETTGVFVSASRSAVTFNHLIADNDFAYATVELLENTNGQSLPARVVYEGKENYLDSGNKKIVKLKVIPLKAGNVTYKITLDNGVSKSVTFRVVDTFDNLSVNIAGFGNDGVQSSEKVVDKGEDFDDELKLVIQNNTYKDSKGVTEVSFGKVATVVLSSASGTSVFGDVSYSITNSSVISIETKNKTTFSLKTLDFGDGYVDFKAKGIDIDDFKTITTEKHVKVSFTSFVPVYSLSVQDDKGNLANNISLYVGNVVSDATLQTANLSVNVDPENKVYGFFDPATSKMVNSGYDSKYVYWTVNAANAYNSETNVLAENGRMVYGQTYKVGADPFNYFGTFNTVTNEFVVNKEMKSTFSFTMFASIGQYGVSKYFSVNIYGETYDFVERIYTNLGENSINFSPTKTTCDIGVFLNPSNATDTDIMALYTSMNTETSDPQLITDSDVVISQISGGVNLLTISLNENVFKGYTGSLSGVLQIIPKAWYVNGSIISGYENSVVKILITYGDGTENNPYSLGSAEDIIKIGENAAAMGAHYKISTTIDLSAYSNSLPLGDGTFSGSIIGEGDASIIGLKIKNGKDGVYGLFKSVSGTIKNITFKGEFNIDDSSTGSIVVGLLSGKAEKGAILNNISAYITGGTITSDSDDVTFGGLVGTSLATITDMCVIYEDYVNINSESKSESKNVNAGGIVGTSRGQIKGREDISERFGISAYSVYSLIRIGSKDKMIPEYGNAASVVAVQNGSSITNILAGGVIFAMNAGGIASVFENGGKATINNLTIRTQVRGQNVGFIAVTAGSDSLNNDDFSNFKVQAIDDGVSTGIYSSAYVKIKESIDASEDIKYDTDGKISLDSLLFANSAYTPLDSTTFVSYVNRDTIDLSYTINNDFSTDKYFGDVIFVSQSDSVVYKNYFFDKGSVSLNVRANTDEGFKQLSSQDENDKTKVIFAYYFEAAGYYDESGFSTEQVYKAQEILDSLNHVKISDKFYPIVIEGTDVSVSSKSSLIEISASGELYIKGTGVAELEVSSLLNKNKNEKIYLYIINYFNINSYLKTSGEKETGIFTLDDLVLGENSEFKVYSNAGVDVIISPSYKYENFKLDVGGDNLDVNISSSGLVKIGNDLIQLKKNRDVSASVSGVLNYGTAISSRDGITFTKKGGVGKDETDKIDLKATLSQEIAGKTYSLDITTLKDVKITYYEGAKNIKTGSENYVLSSSITIEDTYAIDSDDKDDEIDETACEFVDSETGAKTSLFNLTLNKDSDLKYSAKINVNKSADEFVNRFKNNIYKTYILKLKAKSNDEYLKEIPITLVQENVDVIAFANYKIIGIDSENVQYGLEEYNNIIPGTRGILSVSLSPIDADFDYLQITNNEMNTAKGASLGTFVLGKWNKDTGFEQIQGAEYVDGGVRISKANLENAFEGNGYQGQVYVRYIFSNKDVEDGAQVGIDISVEQSGGRISRTAKFSYYKKDEISLSLFGYNNKQYVARGLEYELDVKTVGYDSETISLSSNKPQQAAIIQRDEKYYLKITDDPIDYGTKGADFEITLSASKKDVSGNLETEAKTLKLSILEYVINFDNTLNQDIVSGVENGTMNIAVGDKRQLAISFDGLIEYNKENSNVESTITSFLNELSTKGNWTIYTDLNQNNISGESTKDLPINEGNATKSIVSAGEEFKIKYLKISDLSLTTLQSHNPLTAKRYFFSYDAKYSISGGKYKFSTSEEGYLINSKFDVYSYMRGSEESPNPVTNYKEFLAMEQGGYYIQLADIRVSADEFDPLNTAIKYYDGNSYKFIFDDGEYKIGEKTAVGLFGTVNSNTIIKNITIQTGSEEVDYVKFSSTSAAAINFGFVAGVNNGTITNAQITNIGLSVSLAFSNIPAAEGYYFGGVAGQNNGYITHSQSYVTLESCISMGGLVGTNSGIIASSMFKGGKLTNTSNYNDVFGVGGLVAVNSENAVIITSFSSGDVDGNCVYADYHKDEISSSALISSVPLGGLVYINDGAIRDCYSNIPLVTTSRSAGFVFNNNGKIVRSFSTSKITNDNSAANYYFAGDSEGTFENCYYITGKKINKTLSSLVHKGVKALTYDEEDGKIEKNDFENLAEYFEDYSYSNAPSYNSVWFFSDGAKSTSFPSQQFAGGRLELVSANIIATSKKENVKTTLNSDGIATYIYATASGSPDDGSVFNPYVIYSPETMESYLVTSSKVASGNYRLVCPLDYSAKPSDYSKLYSIAMKGNFEANNMTISGIKISSNEQLAYAGLFGAVIGSANGVNASIMNLNLYPKEVIFNNAAEVGGLVGRAQNANIYNINIYGATEGDEVDVDDELATVTGKNIVGGIVGLARDGYNFKNLRSLIGAFAANVPCDSSEIDYEKENSDYNNLSFVGGIAGYLAGSGKVRNVTVERAAINIIGGKAGFVFGGISKGALAENICLKFNSAMRMKPYRYAGFIAGEIKGGISGAYVYGYTTIAEGTEEIFALKPYTANAIGGIAGILNGGQISLAYIDQGLTIAGRQTSSVKIDTVGCVGGIVGSVKGNGNKISQVIVAGDLTAKNTLGGIVGELSADSSLVVSEAAYKANVLTLEGQNASPTIGGLIGNVENNASLEISNSYNSADIVVKTYTYSTEIDAAFGGIIGKTSKNGRIQLKNIYSASIYNILVENKTSTDVAGMVYDGWVADSTTGERSYVDDGYYLDGNGKTGGEIEDEGDETNGEANKAKNALRQVNYSLTQTATSCTNVYNSSIYSMPKDSLGGMLERGYTTLFARKFGSTVINVAQSEYGVDLYDIIKGNLTTDTSLLTNVEYTINTAFKDMFNGDSVWKISDGKNPYLAFEEEFKLIS